MINIVNENIKLDRNSPMDQFIGNKVISENMFSGFTLVVAMNKAFYTNIISSRKKSCKFACVKTHILVLELFKNTSCSRTKK